jgi:hypothetical protein
MDLVAFFLLTDGNSQVEKILPYLVAGNAGDVFQFFRGYVRVFREIQLQQGFVIKRNPANDPQADFLSYSPLDIV